VVGGAPLADAVIAGESALNSTFGAFRSATQNLTATAIISAAPWAAPVAQVALNHASALGESVQSIAGVPSSGLSLANEVGSNVGDMRVPPCQSAVPCAAFSRARTQCPPSGRG
jgi:hypothetical protein